MAENKKSASLDAPFKIDFSKATNDMVANSYSIKFYSENIPEQLQHFDNWRPVPVTLSDDDTHYEKHLELNYQGKSWLNGGVTSFNKAVTDINSLNNKVKGSTVTSLLGMLLPKTDTATIAVLDIDQHGKHKLDTYSLYNDFIKAYPSLADTYTELSASNGIHAVFIVSLADIDKLKHDLNYGTADKLKHDGKDELYIGSETNRMITFTGNVYGLSLDSKLLKRLSYDDFKQVYLMATEDTAFRNPIDPDNQTMIQGLSTDGSIPETDKDIKSLVKRACTKDPIFEALYYHNDGYGTKFELDIANNSISEARMHMLKMLIEVSNGDLPLVKKAYMYRKGMLKKEYAKLLTTRATEDGKRLPFIDCEIITASKQAQVDLITPEARTYLKALYKDKYRLLSRGLLAERDLKPFDTELISNWLNAYIQRNNIKDTPVKEISSEELTLIQQALAPFNTMLKAITPKWLQCFCYPKSKELKNGTKYEGIKLHILPSISLFADYLVSANYLIKPSKDKGGYRYLPEYNSWSSFGTQTTLSEYLGSETVTALDSWNIKEDIIQTKFNREVPKLTISKMQAKAGKLLPRVENLERATSPNKVAFKGGIFDFETGKYTKTHGLEAMHLFCVNKHEIAPDFNDYKKNSELFIKRLELMVGTENVLPVMRFLGFCYHFGGYKYFQIMLTLYGKGNDGKSIFTDYISHNFFGYDNVSSVGLDDITDSGNRFIQSRLEGMELNTSTENNNMGFKHPNTIKELTGNDFTTSERKGKDSHNFRNHAKFFSATNELPRFKSGKAEDSIMRRYLIIPTLHIEINKGSKYWSACEGWEKQTPYAIAYCLKLYSKELQKKINDSNYQWQTTQSMKQLKDTLVQESDSFKAWYDEGLVNLILSSRDTIQHTEINKNGTTIDTIKVEHPYRYTSYVLYTRYLTYCRNIGIGFLSKIAFCRRLNSIPEIKRVRTSSSSEYDLTKLAKKIKEEKAG